MPLLSNKIKKDKEYLLKNDLFDISNLSIDYYIKEVEKLEESNKELLAVLKENTRIMLEIQKLKSYEEIVKWIKSLDFQDDEDLIKKIEDLNK
jgi:cell division protein FtsL